MTLDEMNDKLASMQLRYGITELNVKGILSKYLQDNGVESLEKEPIERLFVFAESIYKLNGAKKPEIDMYKIASMKDRRFTLEELKSFPIPLPEKISGYIETSRTIRLNPKKIVDHYDLLSPITSLFSDKSRYLIHPLTWGVTVFNIYPFNKALKLAVFSYNRCCIYKKRNNEIQGRFHFNRYSVKTICRLLPHLKKNYFGHYNNANLYMPNQSIEDVLAILTSKEYIKYTEKRNDFTAKMYQPVRKDLQKAVKENIIDFNNKLRRMGVKPYSEDE